MQVSFDSNAWEKVFDPADHDWAVVRSAISSERIAPVYLRSLPEGVADAVHEPLWLFAEASAQSWPARPYLAQ